MMIDDEEGVSIFEKRIVEFFFIFFYFIELNLINVFVCCCVV